MNIGKTVYSTVDLCENHSSKFMVYNLYCIYNINIKIIPTGGLFNINTYVW